MSNVVCRADHGTVQEAHHGDRSGRDDRSGRRQRDEFEALLAEVLVEYELAGSKVLEVLRHASGATVVTSDGR